MTLASKIFLAVKAIVVSLFCLNQSQNSYFVYLNNPETLQSTGILHKKTFDKNSNVRYFFHYVNGTKSPQKFSVTTNNTVNNLKKSINTDERPEYAGAISVKNFLLAKPSNQKINATSIVCPEDTISGMIEGNFTKGDTITYQFGNQTTKLESFDVYQQNHIYNVPLTVTMECSASYKLGNGIESTVRGQYGSNINIEITPQQTGILKLSFSPRGGAGLLVFSNRGKIFITKLMPAFKKYDAFMISVEKGKKETFTFIPCGGLNYPINLDFSLQSYELNPDIA